MQSFLTFLEKSNNVMYDKKELKDRIKVLKKFQKFIEAREKNNINMKPKRYELK
jgi:hypothetical protein